MAVNETSRDLAFCQYAILDKHIFEVEDAIKDSRFKDNILVTGDSSIRFYGGQPMVDLNGYAFGTLCVIDRKPKKLNESQKEALPLLLTLIETELLDNLKVLQKAEDNLKLINSMGHKLYGTLSSVGIIRLSTITNELEQLPAVDPEGLRNLIRRLQDEVNIIVIQLSGNVGL